MRVTVFISSLYGGGAERVACNLSSYLATNGALVECLTMADSKKKYAMNKDVRIYSLGNNKIIKIIKFLKYIIWKKTDVYVVFLPVPTILMLLFSKLIKGKIVVSERADPEKYSMQKRKWIVRLCNRADAYVFQTDTVKEWYIKNGYKGKYKIIPNAINPDFFGEIYHGNRTNEIVGIGRLTNQKRFDLLIDAFQIVHKKYSNFKLYIYGDGIEKEKLQSKISDFKLDNYAFLVGNVEDIKSRIYKSKFFVLSSDYEGMPNALLESMALGLTCISTDCDGGGARFLIKNNYNGLLIEKNDVEQMAQAIIKVIEDDDLAERLRENASKIKDSLSPEYIYGEWKKIIVDKN